MIRIKIAGFVVELDNRFSYLEQQCRDYITDEGPVDLALSVTPDEIDAERALSAKDFDDGYLESICTYRKLCFALLKKGAFLLHASVLSVDGEGYALSGASGIGKSTQTRLWLQYFGDRAFVVNGDKPLVRRVGDRLFAYGTPWCGKEGIQTNCSVPLKKVFYLSRSETPWCRPASEDEIIEGFFEQTLRPDDPELMSCLFDRLDDWLSCTACFCMGCNLSGDNARLAEEAVVE